MLPKTAFKKGNVPWNKGLTKEDPRVASYLSKGSPFKKGRRPTEHWYSVMRERDPWNKGMKGFLAGSTNPNWKGGRQTSGNGYVYLLMPDHPQADKRGRIFEHRYVMELKIGRLLDKSEHVDHINRIRDDNRIENLRIVTRSQNQTNRGKQSNNTTGHKGVFYDKRRNKYYAHITYKGETHYLGSFNNIEEASQAYENASIKLHGEFRNK